MCTCKWFSIQCESTDSNNAVQLAVFIRMVFEDFSLQEELLTLLPLKTTTRGVDIYNVVKKYFGEKKCGVRKIGVNNNWMLSRYDREALLQTAKQTQIFLFFLTVSSNSPFVGFHHVMMPVIKIMNSVWEKASQHQSSDSFLEELPTWMTPSEWTHQTTRPMSTVWRSNISLKV